VENQCRGSDFFNLEDENRQDLLNSILNSVVDIDKIDYLIETAFIVGLTMEWVSILIGWWMLYTLMKKATVYV